MSDTRLKGSNGHGGYAFGPFVVDSVKRQLWRERRLVPITSKTFDEPISRRGAHEFIDVGNGGRQ